MHFFIFLFSFFYFFLIKLKCYRSNFKSCLNNQRMDANACELAEALSKQTETVQTKTCAVTIYDENGNERLCPNAVSQSKAKYLNPVCCKHHDAKPGTIALQEYKIFKELNQLEKKISKIENYLNGGKKCSVLTDAGQCNNLVPAQSAKKPNPVCGMHCTAKNDPAHSEYVEHVVKNWLDDLITEVEIDLNGPKCMKCDETAATQTFAKQKNGRFTKICNRCHAICFKHSENPLGRNENAPQIICYNGVCTPCKRNGKFQCSLCHFDDCYIRIKHGSAYGQFCEFHFKLENPDHAFTRNHKTKEKLFLPLLENFLQNIDGIEDMQINPKLNIELLDDYNEPHKILPDFIIFLTHRIIFVEFDEHQHTHGIQYEPEKEKRRTEALHDYAERLNKKCLIMRFNPDSYVAKDKTRFKSCFKVFQETKLDVIRDDQEWQVRVTHFLEELQNYLRCDSEQLPLYDLYYFFDGFDTSVLSGVASSSRKRNLEQFEANGSAC